MTDRLHSSRGSTRLRGSPVCWWGVSGSGVSHNGAVHSESAVRSFLVGMLWTLCGAVAIFVVWLAVTGLLGWRAASGLESQSEDLANAFREGNTDAALAILPEMRDSAATADTRFNSAPWSWAVDFPVVGPSARLVGLVAQGIGAVTATTEGHDEVVADAVRRLKEQGASGIAGLEDLAPMTDEAAAAIAPYEERVNSISPDAVIGARMQELQTDFLEVVTGVEAAAGAAHALPAMMGAKGDRTWMVIVQNTAEARGTGGLIGAYAIVEVKNGKFSPVTAETTNELSRSQTIPLAGIPTGTRRFWGKSLTKWWGLNSDRNFPFAGKLSARGIAMAGSPVDDVISLDSRAVAALLEGTGPVSSRGVTIDSENAAEFFTKEIYKRFPDPEVKDEVTIALTEKMLSGLANKPLDLAKLWDALGPAAEEGRLLTYSTDKRVQAQLERMPTAGIVPDEAGPWATVAINDMAGSKMEAYVQTEINYDSAAMCPAADALSRITVSVTNNAPKGLPDYVDIRSDGGRGGRGSTKVAVAAYAPVGSQLEGHSIDGRSSPITAGLNRSHPTWMTAMELSRGQTRVFTVDFVEPRGWGVVPKFSVQPMTNDVHVDVSAANC